MTNVKTVFDISPVFGEMVGSLKEPIDTKTFEFVEKTSRKPENIAHYIYGGEFFDGKEKVKTPGLLGLYAPENSNPLSGDDTMGLIDPFFAFSGPSVGYIAGIAYERLGEADMYGASAEVSGYKDITRPLSVYILPVALSLLGSEEKKEVKI